MRRVPDEVEFTRGALPAVEAGNDESHAGVICRHIDHGLGFNHSEAPPIVSNTDGVPLAGNIIAI